MDENVKVLFLHLTDRCNLNCNYCYIKKNSKDLKLEIAKKGIDAFLDTQGDRKEVHFFGGEPLLKFNAMKKITDYLKIKSREKGKNVHYMGLTTNGTIINQKIVDFLNKNKIQPQVSIDGAKTSHNKNRKNFNGKNSYEKIIKNLMLFKKCNDLRVRMTIHPNQLNNIYRNFLFMVRNYGRYLGFGPVRGTVKWKYEQIKIFEKETDKIVLFFLNKMKKGDYMNIGDVTKDIVSIIGNDRLSSCSIGKTLALAPDGKFYPCHYAYGLVTQNKKLNKKFLIGDIYEGVNHKKRKSFLQNICPAYSKDCDMVPYCCNNICLFYDVKTGKQFDKETIKINCLLRKIMFNSSLKIYNALLKERNSLFLNKFFNLDAEKRAKVLSDLETKKIKKIDVGALNDFKLKKFEREKENLISLRLKYRDLSNKETKKAIKSFLEKLEKNKISFKITKPLPPCIIENKGMFKNYKIPTSCDDCLEFYHILKDGRVKLCSGRIIEFREFTENHEDILKEMHNKNFFLKDLCSKCKLINSCEGLCYLEKKDFLS